MRRSKRKVPRKFNRRQFMIHPKDFMFIDEPDELLNDWMLSVPSEGGK